MIQFGSDCYQVSLSLSFSPSLPPSLPPFLPPSHLTHARTHTQVDSSSHVIFEQNRCVGVNLFSHGSAMGATYGGPSSSFIFFAANHIQVPAYLLSACLPFNL